MAKKRPQPTFVVRLVAPELTPEKIPLRAVSEAMAAIQDLASGRDPLQTLQVPPDKTISLVDVQRGSARYICVAKAPQEAVRNLNRVGTILASIDGKRSQINNEHLIAAINPLRSLSDVAKQIGGKVEVSLIGKEPLFAIQSGDYRRIAGRLFMKGETTVNGTVERVGGATGMRCVLRLAGRRKLLFCDVKPTGDRDPRDLVRKLGQHLYEDISATGQAVWIHRTWYIYKFTIHDFAQPRLGNARRALSSLRESGLSAWDDVENPEELIRGLRQ